MRQHQKPELVLFYDDHCPICTASAEHMRRADRRNLVTVVPASDTEALRRHGITVEQALSGLQGVLLQSTKHVDGIHALYEAAKRLPRWWAAVPLLWLSTRLGFGQRLYDAIAVRRFGISRLVCAGACPAPHERERNSPEPAPQEPKHESPEPAPQEPKHESPEPALHEAER